MVVNGELHNVQYLKSKMAQSLGLRGNYFVYAVYF